RTDQHKSKGQEEADGPHLTVSGLSLWRLGTVFVAALITIKRFQSSAPKAQNGFVAGRIVSSPVVRRHISHQCKHFQ
ncbi:MAG TPA: hypothetical protein VHJ00_19265, partial [Bradyrhizobium sp.]|nr:hypothetical protein [Bradyrhizobium sp.]